MDAVDYDEPPTTPVDDPQSIRCGMCETALQSPSRDTLSFLLLDQFTVPLVGCSDHTEQFGTVCGLTTEESATVLQHRPAGGLQCPGCRHAFRQPQHPVVPVGTGAVAVLACPTHQGDIIGRFQTGLQTQHHLTASLASQ